MKRKNIFKIILFTVIVAATFEACTKSEDGSVTTDRDKFIGTWHASSIGNHSGSLTWDVNITAGTSSATQIKLENFHQEGEGTFLIGEIDGDNISIPHNGTNIIASDTIFGSGNYNSNGSLNFSYTVNDGQTSDNATVTGAHK